MPAHGSGATRIATPSSQWTFTTYSLPVSRRTHSRCGLHTRAVTVFRDPLSEGFRHFVSSMPAPVASGWSGCRVGLAPLESAALSRRTPLCGHSRRSSAPATHWISRATVKRFDIFEVLHIRVGLRPLFPHFLGQGTMRHLPGARPLQIVINRKF